MITTTDVAQLNQSMNNLGDSFMQTRMLKDREAELANENRFKQEGIDIAKERNSIANRHYEGQNQVAQMKADIEAYTKLHQAFQNEANSGNVTPERIQEMNQILAQHPGHAPLKAILQVSKPQPKVHVLSEGAGMYDETGRAIVPKPPDKPLVGNDYTETREETDIPGQDAVPEQPGSPAVKHWFKADEPEKPAVPGKPAVPPKKIVTTTRTPNRFIGSRTNAPAAGASDGKPLDRDTAAALLEEANGDKDLARKLAIQRGFTF